MTARRRWIPVALVLLALVGAEGGARLLAPRLAWRPLPPFGRGAIQTQWLERTERELAQGAPPPGYCRFDAELGWSPIAGHVSPAKDIHVNAQGLRGEREYAPEPPPGMRRVIACGESFTFGEEVLDHEAWTARMEALAPDLEVLNYGVGGYGTDQALLRARREVRGPADALLVGLMLENIGRNVNRYRPLWYPSAQPAPKPRFVLDAGGLELVPQPFPTRAEFTAAVRSGEVFARLAPHEHWAASPVPTWMLGSMLVRLAASARGYAARELAPLWADTAGEPFQVTLALLEAFRPLAAELGGARLVVLVFPMRGHLEEARAGTRTWATLLTALEARGIEFLDLSEVLVEAGRDGGPDDLYLASHYSPRGNDLVARAVLAFLEAGPPR